MNEMSERPRKRQAERSAAKSTASTPLSFSAARSDDGNDDEFPDEEYAMKAATEQRGREQNAPEEAAGGSGHREASEATPRRELCSRTVGRSNPLRHELGLLKEMVLSFASNRTRANEPNAEEKPGNFRGLRRRRTTVLNDR
ncbi:hypothetical protein M3Y99_00408700 [Aphelenchoides fujianensis]|nr:hypothetical protein M3Y99_00408700 [Aphelenchoides fujianensis]